MKIIKNGMIIVFCCNRMKTEFTEEQSYGIVSKEYDKGGRYVFVTENVTTTSEMCKINYCPYCGAKIEASLRLPVQGINYEVFDKEVKE